MAPRVPADLPPSVNYRLHELRMAFHHVPAADQERGKLDVVGFEEVEDAFVGVPAVVVEVSAICILSYFRAEAPGSTGSSSPRTSFL